MTKSRIEKQRLAIVKSFGDDPEKFSEDGLKIRYKFYGSIFHKKRVISSKMSSATTVREIIQESARANIPRLLLPIAKQLGHLEYRVHFKCFEQHLSIRNKNSPRIYTLNCSLFAIRSNKTPIKKAKNYYKIRNIVFLGNIVFNDVTTLPKNLPSIFSRFEKHDKISFLEKFSKNLYSLQEIYLFSTIFSRSMKYFPICNLEKYTNFGRMSQNMINIFERFDNEYNFDLNDEVLGGDFNVAYLISANPRWALSFSESLSNSVFATIYKTPVNADSDFKNHLDLDIKNFIKTLNEMGLIEIQDANFQESDIQEIIEYNKMMSY